MYVNKLSLSLKNNKYLPMGSFHTPLKDISYICFLENKTL